MFGDITIYANGKAVMVLRGGKVVSASPGYTAKVVRRGLGPGRGLRRGWRGSAVPPGQALSGPVSYEEVSRMALGQDLFGPVSYEEVSRMALGQDGGLF